MPRPDRHRAALVATTAQLLRRQGYAGTGLGEILAGADATNGSLYHHFPGGKEELALAALQASSAAVEQTLREALAGTEDLAGALAGWLDGLIAALEADPRDGCPVAPVAIEASTASEPLRQAAAGAFASWTVPLETALARHGDPASAAARAHVLIAAIEGALLLDRTARETTHLKALRDGIGAFIAPAAA
jgi:TetR/AcrR family transcriptional repressor of lmrAB and yxaGH operons